jgi:cytoskeletal protein RodZ
LERAESIGEELRLAREERGVPLREISDQTRIAVRYLEAIEANDYKRLPGGIFNRSFIKAYARAVGYDEKTAIEGYTRYLREQGESPDEVVTTPLHSKVYTDTPATRSPILTVVLTIVILALLTLAALAGLHWYQKRSARAEHDAQERVDLLVVNNSKVRQPNASFSKVRRKCCEDQALPEERKLQRRLPATMAGSTVYRSQLITL